MKQFNRMPTASGIQIKEKSQKTVERQNHIERDRKVLQQVGGQDDENAEYRDRQCDHAEDAYLYRYLLTALGMFPKLVEILIHASSRVDGRVSCARH